MWVRQLGMEKFHLVEYRSEASASFKAMCGRRLWERFVPAGDRLHDKPADHRCCRRCLEWKAKQEGICLERL